MKVNLEERLKKIVEKKVLSYKADVLYDLRTIADPLEESEFYWSVRHCGTNLYHSKEVFIEDSTENCVCNYYLQDADFYKITIEDKKNLLGSIKKVDMADLLKKHTVKGDCIMAKIKILTTQGDIIELPEMVFSYDTLFEDAVNAANISEDEVQNMYKKIA